MKLLLDYSDGRYTALPLTAEEAAKAEEAGCDVAFLEDYNYAAYQRHCAQDDIWQGLWRAHCNEQYARRENKLMTLEGAEHEIERLKAELERAQQQLAGRPPEEYVEKYTCVFPQPGCDVTLLPAEWQEEAKKILGRYNIEWAGEGLKVQGCCCGYAHKKLGDGMTALLRNAGFIVEHDSETASC